MAQTIFGTSPPRRLGRSIDVWFDSRDFDRSKSVVFCFPTNTGTRQLFSLEIDPIKETPATLAKKLNELALQLAMEG